MFCVRDLIVAYCTTNAFALLLSVILSLLLWHVMIWNLLALVFPSRARMSFYVLVQLLRRSISSTCSLHNLSFLSLIMSFTSWQHKSTPVCGLSCFSLIYFFTYLVNWFLETGLDLLIVFLGMSLFAAFLPLLVCDTARAVPFVLLMMHFLLVFHSLTFRFFLLHTKSLIWTRPSSAYIVQNLILLLRKNSVWEDLKICGVWCSSAA